MSWLVSGWSSLSADTHQQGRVCTYCLDALPSLNSATMSWNLLGVLARCVLNSNAHR